MRINHANLARNIVYGTSAVKIADPGSEATHRWKVYVRGYENSDISYFIRSVTFKIHETFANPTRSIDAPPFEIEETGWGEFTIQGKIYFTDVHEKPVPFHVSLKLHPDSGNKLIGDVEYTKDTVYNERMDTVIFDSPTEATYKIIKNSTEPDLDREIKRKIADEKERISAAIDYIIEKLENEPTK